MEEMTRKELWQWELVGCCEMQVAALRKKLRQVAAVDEWLMDLKMFEGTLRPSIAAAPRDETLFDSVCLMAQFIMGRGVMLRGSIRYWSPSESYSQGGRHQAVSQHRRVHSLAGGREGGRQSVR